MNEEELISTGLDFWFLGHTHVRIPARDKFAGCAFAYCGTPEPDGFDCRHEGSAWIIQFKEQGPVEGEAVVTGNYLFRDLLEEVNSGEGLKLVRRLAPDGAHPGPVKIRGHPAREDFESRHHWREAKTAILFRMDDSGCRWKSAGTLSPNFIRWFLSYLLLERLAKKEDRGPVAYRLLKEQNLSMYIRKHKEPSAGLPAWHNLSRG